VKKTPRHVVVSSDTARIMEGRSETKPSIRHEPQVFIPPDLFAKASRSMRRHIVKKKGTGR